MSASAAATTTALPSARIEFDVRVSPPHHVFFAPPSSGRALARRRPSSAHASTRPPAPNNPHPKKNIQNCTQLPASIDAADIARLAERAGRAVLRVYESGDFGAEAKGDGSPLTRADTASHAVIAQGLAELAPHVPVVSEEGGAQKPYAQRRRYALCWVVDPLDGTKEFVKRNGEFTVMIGLVAAGGSGGKKKGKGGEGAAAGGGKEEDEEEEQAEEEGCRAVAGAVHVPCTGKTYYAAEGKGAFVREGADMSPGAQEEIERAYSRAADPAADSAAAPPPSSSSSDKALRAAADALADRGVSARRIACAEFRESDPALALVASASHLSAETEAFCARFREPAFKQVGSSLKMMLVAEGSAHCYPRLAPTMEWDTAAADVIVREAGGEVLRCGACDGRTGKLLEGVDWRAELSRGKPVIYNKRDLLNTYFVCWGRRVIE